MKPDEAHAQLSAQALGRAVEELLDARAYVVSARDHVPADLGADPLFKDLLHKLDAVRFQAMAIAIVAEIYVGDEIQAKEPA